MWSFWERVPAQFSPSLTESVPFASVFCRASHSVAETPHSLFSLQMLTCDSTPRFLICISHLILPCSLTKCSDGPVFAYPQNPRRVLPKKSVVRTFSLTLPALRCPVVQPGSVLSHQLELWRLECEVRRSQPLDNGKYQNESEVPEWPFYWEIS